MVEASLPPTADTCAVCGKAVGAEPHWLVDGNRRVHHLCRDWRAVPFPFSQQLRTLRRVLVELRKAARETIATGRALQRIKRRWPEGGRDAYDDGQRHVARVRERLERIGAMAKRLW